MFVCLLLDYAFDALMRVNISRILVRTPMHNVPQSVWMGLKTCAGPHIFCLLVLPTALWEIFLVPICGTALKVHQGPAILLLFAVCSCRCKKIQHGWKRKLNWWSFFHLERFLFVCFFLVMVWSWLTRHGTTKQDSPEFNYWQLCKSRQQFCN